MEFRRLAIPDVIEITPRKFGDHRGYFAETFKREALAAEGVDIDWMQDNQSLSAEVGTVRALHYQIPPVAQDKLVRVVAGAVFDVAVDIRRGSPTYGQWVGVELDAERLNQLLVPRGFAHGFMTLRPGTIVQYKVSAPYSPDHEGAILWNDADIGIDWPDAGAAILSAKDAVAPAFCDHVPSFQFGAVE